MPRQNRGAYLVWIAKRDAFYIQWYDAGTKHQRSTGTRDRGDAESQLAAFIVERHRRELPTGPRHPGEFPIADALTLYLAEHAPTTAAPWRLAMAATPLLDFWGEHMTSAITQETCRAYCRQRERSDGTLRKELGTLRSSLNYAERHGRLTKAPAVFLPSRPEGKDRFLTRGEGARLLRAAISSRGDTRLYLPLFIVLALYTGARKEALLSLRWPQVDLERRLIDFNPPGRKRTSKGRPKQPISRRLALFLRLARRRGSDLGYVINRSGKRILDIGDANSGSFGRACARAGLSDVTPHTLRHTCGTWLAQEGVDLFKIGGWLGHSGARTTELYAHHHPDFMGSVLAALDRR